MASIFKTFVCVFLPLFTIVFSCPSPNASDEQILTESPHLQAIFNRYADGENGSVITLQGFQKLLNNLGLNLHADDHHDHSDHVTHDHNPDGSHKRNNHLDHDHYHDLSHGHDMAHPMIVDGNANNSGMKDSSRLAANRNDSFNVDGHSKDQDKHKSHDSHKQHLNGNDHNKEHINENEQDPHKYHSHGNPNDAGSRRGGPQKMKPESSVLVHREERDHDGHGRKDVNGEGTVAVDDTRLITKSSEQPPLLCNGLRGLLAGSGVSSGTSISVRGFLSICPGIINYLDTCSSMDLSRNNPIDSEFDSSHPGHDHSHGQHSHSHSNNTSSGHSFEKWVGAFISIFIIGLVGFACIMVIPALKRSQYYDQVNHFLLALAVGTLAGDALIHLLPHAISMHIPLGVNVHLQHALLGFTALVGIFIFLFLERGHNIFCGHGHSHNGHSHDPTLNLATSKEEVDKETVGTATTIEDGGSNSVDKIGEKLCKHSNHNSFIYAESTMSLDAQNCFEGCSSNVSPSSDANGNSDLDKVKLDDQVAAIPEKQGLVSSLESESNFSSLERQVAKLAEERKMESCTAEKEKLVTTPVEKSDMSGKLSLPLDTPTMGRHRVLRQNSSNFNMVLQEYHVSHHGHSHHGHSHVTGRKDSLRAVILVGDALHTFLDGMAIGAAYGTSVTGGIATSIAVLCHELPHKVGDFALLFEMGMKLTMAVKMLILLWILSLLGVILGVCLGSIQTASPWIYSFTAGVFMYLALVDLLSELSVNPGEKLGMGGQMLLHALGMLVGSFIMLAIAIYEHDLHDLLEGAL